MADYVRDGAVLAAGVHALEHEQQRALVLGIEPLLELEELRLVLGQILQRLLVAFEAGGRRRVDLREPEAAVLHLGSKQVANLLRHAVSV